MEFYVLQNSEILGPFTRDELAAKIEDGVFTMRHMAQEKGKVHWTPISRLFQPEESTSSAGNEAVAPDWRTILQWGYLRLRASFEDRPALAGGIGLIVGLLFFFLSFFPVLFWLPWFAAALLASILMIRAGKVRTGAILMAAAVLLPAALAFAFNKSRGALLQKPAEENVSAEAPPVRSARSASEDASTRSVPRIAETPNVAAQESLPAPVVTRPSQKPEKPPALSKAEESPVNPSLLLPPKPGNAAFVLNKPVQAPAPVLPPLPPPVLLSPGGALPKPNQQPEQLVQDFNNSLIFIDDNSGITGSGFIGQFEGKSFIYTNVHVVAGMKAPRFTRLDRSPITLGAASAAAGQDVMRYEEPSIIRLLQIMDAVESNALIGDEVTILGDNEGSHIILPLTGNISGIGPNMVEVTAQFVSGNSGSPIIHKKSGKVIGIATYLVNRDMEWFSDYVSDKQKAKKIRRFGSRIDSIARWQPINWPQFNAENAELEKVRMLSRDLSRFLDDLRLDSVITPGMHQNPSINRLVQAFLETSVRRHISAEDKVKNLQRFRSDMRYASQADIIAARPRIRYDYFQRAFTDEEPVRSQFREMFDRLFTEQM